MITWTAPFDQGSAITGYRVYIQHADGIAYSEDLTDCNRLTTPSLTCTVPVTTLVTTPFSIAWGNSVYAKVVALNVYGPS